MKILKSLRHDNGLFVASYNDTYRKAWLRDNLWIQMVFLDNKTIHSLFDFFLKHEYKLDYTPFHAFEYVHARMDPYTLEEFDEEWGNKQNDAVGFFLFLAVDETRDENDERIIQKLIYYLNRIKYWENKDNGVWEEYEEVHASSVGCCVAGLKKCLDYHIPKDLIKKGQDVLNNLLPRESITKETDLALLYLIYPLNIVTPVQKKKILKGVESLVRDKGVLRYNGDKYYNFGKEAEWCMGLSWLYICTGNDDYLDKAENCMLDGFIPESYYEGGVANNPLGWAHTLLLLAKKL